MNRNRHNTKMHYQKLHYKMYKSGKQWVISGIITAATALTITTMGSANNVSAKADVQGTQSNNSSTESSGNNVSASQANLNNIQTQSANGSVRSDGAIYYTNSSNTSNTQTSSSSASSVNNSASASSNDSSSESATSSNSSLSSSSNFSLGASLASGANVTTSGSFSMENNATSGANSSNSSNSSMQSTTNNSSSTNFSVQSSTTSSNSGLSAQSGANSDSITSSLTAKGSGTDLSSLATKLLNSLIPNADSGSISISNGSMNASSASNFNMDSISLNASLASNASDDLKSHVKEVDGKYYYYNNGNKISRSLLINDNGNYYYFDQNAELSTANPSFVDDTKGTITTDANNAIYSADSNNINNVDGFLTPDSWYRPKAILKDGTTWQASTDTDYRPLLTVWWPSKDVEANYLNYMSQQGLASNANYSSTSDQADLNAAAQAVQANIEKKISANNGDTTWLKTAINSFIKTQSQWNAISESINYNDGFQGGTLAYQNNSQTPNTNSDYRLLNRNPSQQDGKLNYTKSDYVGYEFLLANDVDNSNPVVQAEDLNWLHYLMNFGSITQNDSNANFDSIRVDAVDNMDADIVNIAAQYFKDVYKVDQSEQNANNHISILENWSPNDPYAESDQGSNQLSIDSSFLNSITSNLFSNPSQRGNLSSLINGIVNRSNDNNYNSAIPNYSIVRAHDSGVQTIIAKIINDKLNDGGPITQDKIDEAFQIYNADENSTNKQYTQYNIPSSYALMLTNKDTIPRVYYGDMYTDNGQYMANQSPYFNAIDEMLKGRIKYVAGGQSMNLQYVNGANASDDNGTNSILTSVRYGKGADDADSTGDATTRNSGIAVVMSNNPDLKLSDNDKIVIDMGAAHKNQTYRPLVDSTDQGLVTYDNDVTVGSNIVSTNDQGQLILDASKIKGYSNPQVSGYLSMWVPFGASSDQDVRTSSSNEKIDDGKTYHSNAALDSNVFFEGFSNFQSMPTNNDQYTNVILAKNANMFNQWGVTYMELAPQYRSTTDNSFIDSIVQNGYAFNDRYDLGFNTPTKYGTASQLADAIRSFHNSGIKVIADYVPDQLYQFPNRQVVSVTRTDSSGNLNGDTNMIDTLYDSYTKGSGTDYQAKYGGAFLDELKAKYPDLFTTNQISTGKPIDGSTKIRTWEAKYFNGTNIQGAGSGSVLSNAFGSDYFTVPTAENESIKSAFLPKQLSGSDVTYGLSNVDGKMRYVSTSGYVARDTFLQSDDGSWYYVDDDGDFVTKPTVIKNNDYYFLSNGMNLRNFILRASDGKLYYYQNNGTKATVSKYYTDSNRSIYVNPDGTLAVGLQKINSSEQYFNEDGSQVKGAFVDVDGHKLYFDPQLGNLIMNSYFTTGNNWYYADDKGYVLTGFQTIDGDKQHFNSDGSQTKGQFVTDDNGNKTFYDPNSGALVTNTDFNVDGNQYHASDDGKVLVNDFYRSSDGKLHYFDDTGAMVKDQFVPSDGTFTNFYYFDQNGSSVVGKQDIDGRHHYFDSNGLQVRGAFVTNDDDTLSYYDQQFGNLVIGSSLINGQEYQFSEQGVLQEPNQFVQTGSLDNAVTYYLDSKNQITKGLATINGSKYYFNSKGVMLRDTTVSDNGTTYSATDSGILFTIPSGSGANSGAGSASGSSASSNSANSSSAGGSSASSNSANSSSASGSSASSNSANSSSASGSSASSNSANSSSASGSSASSNSANSSSAGGSSASSNSANSSSASGSSASSNSANSSSASGSSASSNSANSSSASGSSASSNSANSSSASGSSASSNSANSSSASGSSASSNSANSSSASGSSASSNSANSSSASGSSASSNSANSSSASGSSASSNSANSSSASGSSASSNSASSSASATTSSSSNTTGSSSATTNGSSSSSVTASSSSSDSSISSSSSTTPSNSSSVISSSSSHTGSSSASTSESSHHSKGSSHGSKASGKASHTTNSSSSSHLINSSHATSTGHGQVNPTNNGGTMNTSTSSSTGNTGTQNGTTTSQATTSGTVPINNMSDAVNSMASSIASVAASSKAARSSNAKSNAAKENENKHVDKNKDHDNNQSNSNIQHNQPSKPRNNRSTAAMIGFAIVGITLMLIGLFIIIKFVF
ncbi:glycoside hydrolase family 70 protein [Lactobacillaceae bacterium Scapto_B20]